MIRTRKPLVFLMLGLLGAIGCAAKHKPYGIESQLSLPGTRQAVWAVAPALNLSGQREVDPLIQGDVVFRELQQVHGVVGVPVNRVAEVYAALKIENVSSPEQASIVCDLLGCDGLIVPTITAYDPYDPPKLGASLQLFRKPSSYVRPVSIDPRALARSAEPLETDSTPPPSGWVQAVGMFDASDGSVRDAVQKYADGRHDPDGPYAARQYLVAMDRYCGFVYHALIADLLSQIATPAPPAKS